MKTLYFDFEYRDNKKRECIILCTTKIGRQDSVAWDLRDEKGLSIFVSFFEENKNNLWAAYNADADLQCLITLGLKIDDLKVVDLMAEATMIMRTHHKYYSQKASLLTALFMFGIESVVNEEYKDKCRDIILENEIYTEKQWELIVEYGLSDVDLLPDLFAAMMRVHKASKTYKISEEYFEGALSRGEYVKSATILFRKSKGLPINEPLMDRIFKHRDALRNMLCQNVNDAVGVIYIWNKAKNAYVLNNKALAALLSSDPGVKIIRTETGMLSIEELDTMTKGHPKFDIIYRTHQTLQSLSSSDLRLLNKNGYISSGYRTFIQDTGRTSPKPKEGFLLNLTPWMRSLIHPHKGEVLIAADWSQQEIYIGAVLSGDKKLMEAYRSGDIYLHLAKMAGAVPMDGTKKAYPTERQNFKAVQLGIGYGKGIDALAMDIYIGNIKEGIPGLTMEEATRVAKKIMGWHKREFKTYWNWVEDHIQKAQSRGYYKTSDGSWVRFCRHDTSTTKLKNLPFQSGGAALLRQAVKLVRKEGALDMICSLHDAIYILSTEERMEQDKAKLVELMNQACRDIYGEMSKFYDGEEVLVNIDTKVFTNETGYIDERGTEMFNTVMRLLDVVEDVGEVPPRDYEFPVKPTKEKKPTKAQKEKLKRDDVVA